MDRNARSPRWALRILIGGVCSDIAMVLLYFWYEKLVPSNAFLGIALLTAIVLGLGGTWVGSFMWARNASTEAVIAAEFFIILSLLIYDNRVRIGFDDPKGLVFPFASISACLMLIGRLVGPVASR